MKGARKYFRDRRSLVAVGGVYDEVEYRPLVDGAIYHIMRFAVEDEDNTLTGDLRVYVKGHGYEHWLMSQETAAAGQLYWERWPTFLFRGESLVARFTGATANDVLNLYLEGWYWVHPVNRESPLGDGSEDND